MAKNVEYDPNIIQQFANKLYQQANRIINFYSVIFLLVGLGVGIFLDSSLEIGFLKLIVPIVSCLVGYAIGCSIAFNLKLKAQIALCQVKIEENTRK